MATGAGVGECKKGEWQVGKKGGIHISLNEVLEAEERVMKLLDGKTPFESQKVGKPKKKASEKVIGRGKQGEKVRAEIEAENAKKVKGGEKIVTDLVRKTPVIDMTETTITLERKSFFAQFLDIKRYGFEDTAILKYPSPDAFALDVDRYFRSVDEKNVDRNGLYHFYVPYTWSGLMAHIGISRSLLNKLMKMLNYGLIIEMAKTRIESHLLEQALMNRVQPVVALKALAHQHDWKENQELTLAMKNITFTGEDQLKD